MYRPGRRAPRLFCYCCAIGCGGVVRQWSVAACLEPCGDRDGSELCAPLGVEWLCARVLDL
eukprot:scaffold9_cov97-Isochrysis_galbana.AAC.2